MQPELVEHLIAHWPDALSGQCAFEVGLSGGLDSVALLSLLTEVRSIKPQLQLSAVHVHHGLSPHADAWAEHCRQLCRILNIPLRIQKVELNIAGGESLEAVARTARYQAYQASDSKVIVLAHHLDDQAETVMLQLLRGGGVRALAAMPTLRALGDKLIWRPLLGFTRSQLEAWVASRQLSWVEDESNADTRYRRNLLRHDILPRLEATLPHYRQHLARSAGLLAEAVELLDEVSAADLAACRDEGGLNLAAWLGLSPARQRQVLLAWLRELGWSVPEPAALLEWQRQLRDADAASCPEFYLAQGTVLRFRGQILALAAFELPGAQWLGAVDPAEPRDVPAWGGQLRWEWREQGLPDSVLAAGVGLQPRVGGEKLPVKVGRKPVKDILREAGLPPLLRQRWPLLYSAASELLAVPGLAVSQVHAGAAGWWPCWQPQI